MSYFLLNPKLASITVGSRRTALKDTVGEI